MLAVTACSSGDKTEPPPLGWYDSDSGQADSVYALDAASDAASEDAVPESDAMDASTEAPEDSTADAQQPLLHILFIGNSYTYVNDLPKQLEQIAASSGVQPLIATSAVTAGGATLQAHWEGTAAQPAIAAGGWDYVVLQGQSLEPVVDQSNFLTHAALLAGAATQAGAMPAFYETWARADGDAVYQETWSGGSPSAMQDLLYAAYQKAASDNQATLVPVGEAWRKVRTDWPSIVLFQSDGSHPSVAGTWLSACVFYDVLTGHAVPAAVTPPSGVDPADAVHLREAAEAVSSR